MMMKIKEPVVILQINVKEAEWLLAMLSSEIYFGIDNLHPVVTIRDKLTNKD